MEAKNGQVSITIPESEEEVDGEEAKEKDKGDWLRTSSSHFSSYDDNLLHRAVRDAARWAYGTVFVEIWALSDNRTCLFRPEAGWWIDPVYHASVCKNDSTSSCELCRLTDELRSDYVPPNALAPGESLPGFLWSEMARNVSFRGGSAQRSHRSASGILQFGSTSRNSLSVGHFGSASLPQKVFWRSVDAIAKDPDQPWSPRLQLLASSAIGLGWVAAVPFSSPIAGQSGNSSGGIVMFMARQTVDFERLTCPSNEAYLLAAAQLAGAAYALRGPRQQIQEERRSEVHRSISRARNKILSIVRFGGDLGVYVEQKQEQQGDDKPLASSQEEHCCCKSFSVHHILPGVRQRAWTVLLKMLGGGGSPPPSMGWKQSLHTFVGVFVTLLSITGMNNHVKEQYGSDYAIVLGPFGALVTLLYGLTAAPASQPKNALLGQTVSLVIAIGIRQIGGMSVWVQQSLATALAVTAMVYLGVTHPPAGAATLIFASSDKFGWGNMLFLLVGNVVAVAIASFINNWSDQRQYPTYWGVVVPRIDRYVEAGKEEKKNPRKEM